MSNLDLDLCAYILRTGDMTGVISAGVTPEMLDGSGQTIFAELVEFYRKYDGSLPSPSTFEEKTGLDLRELQGLGQDRLEVYLDLLRDRTLANTIRKGSRGIGEALEKRKPAEALDALRTLTRDAQEAYRGPDKLLTMDDMVDERIALYERAEAAQDGVTGHRFPWPILNQSTGGLHPTDFFLIVGKRGLGKSWILANLIVSYVLQGLKVLVISMEMPNVTLQRRLSCVRGVFRPQDVKLGKLNGAKDRYVEFERTAWKDSKLLFTPDGRVKTLADFDAATEEAGKDVDVVLIDGMYLLDQGKQREETWQRVARVSFHVRQHALRAPSLAGGTVQFNRNLRVGSTAANLDQIAHADAMTFDATHVWAIVQDEMLKELKRMRILNLKNREGNEDHADIAWNLDTMNFEEIGRPQDLEDDYSGGGGGGGGGNSDDGVQGDLDSVAF